MQTFIVRAISVEELSDINTFSVTLYDDASAPSEWIEIQRSLITDSQDDDLGMDTYCIVLSSGAVHYGGVEEFTLHRDRLELRLSTSAAKELDIDTEIECYLQIPTDVISRLKTGLERVFENKL